MYRAKGERFVRASELPVCDNGSLCGKEKNRMCEAKFFSILKIEHATA